jgi:hypothetical protein
MLSGYTNQSIMKALHFIALSAVIAISSCGPSKNDYDTHAGNNDSLETTHTEMDTIQGRSSVQRDTGINQSNAGIGDTTIEKTPH